jgi:hypothetical protein
MEKYVILAFSSYCCTNDLQVRGSSFPFTMKLKQLFHEDELRTISGRPKLTFTDATVKFLQNIQNCTHNSLRYKLTEDDLQSISQPFNAKGDGTCIEHEESKEDDEGEEIVQPDDTDSSLLPERLQNYSFKPI